MLYIPAAVPPETGSRVLKFVTEDVVHDRRDFYGRMPACLEELRFLAEKLADRRLPRCILQKVLPGASAVSSSRTGPGVTFTLYGGGDVQVADAQGYYMMYAEPNSCFIYHGTWASPGRMYDDVGMARLPRAMRFVVSFAT